MRRLRWTGAVACAAALLAACGTTTSGVARQDSGLTGGPDRGAVTDVGGAPGLPGTSPGDVPVGGQAGDGLDGIVGGTTDPGTPGRGPTVTAPGRTTAPIQIGLLITQTGRFLAAFGLPSPADLYRASVHALVAEINRKGGVAGRKLVIVDADIEFTAPSWGTEFEAACQKFTQDNHVGAVIYDSTVYNQTFNTCLTKAGVPVFNMGLTGSVVGDDTDFAKNYPGMVAAGQVSLDRRVKSILNKAIAAGFLPSGSKLGILIETCPYGMRAYERTLMPILRRQKVTVFTYEVNCGQGGPDEASIALVQSAALRFKAEGVDTVMFHTVFENGVAYFFAVSAEGANYRPQYLMFHPQGARGSMDYWKSQGAGPQLEKMRGFGGVPIYDVTTPSAPPAAQAAVRKTCMATMKRYEVAGATTPGNEGAVYDSCDVVGVLHLALTLSGGLGGTRHIVPAVARIGTDFVSALTMNGVTRLVPGRRDGMHLTAVSVYQAKCDCFTYITQPTPIS